MRKPVILLAVGALLLVSCRAEVNMALVVEEDRSGTFSFELGFDDEFRELIEAGGESPDLLSELGTDFEGGEAYEREEGVMAYQGVRVEFDDVNQLDDITGQLGDETGGFESFSFDMDDAGATLDGAFVGGDIGEAGDLGELPIDPTAITGELFAANLFVTMPGTVTEHDADEVMSDGRLRWDLPVLGGDATFHAQSEVGGGGFSWLWVILAIVLAVGVAAMIGAAMTGRKREEQAVAEAAAAHQAPAANLPAVPYEPEQPTDEA